MTKTNSDSPKTDTKTDSKPADQTRECGAAESGCSDTGGSKPPKSGIGAEKVGETPSDG